MGEQYDRKFGVVVFGGSGYTGEHVVREMLLTSAAEGVSWAVAGRSREKIEAMLERLGVETGVSINDVGVIIANINNIATITEMCQQTKLVINCVGPYYLWGEVVVKECVEAKTHYLDISGEPLFIEQMEEKYHSQASSTNTCIVSACGFDSVPADVGVQWCQDQFNGTLTAVESYMSVKTGSKGVAVHLPTFQCVVNGFASQGALKAFRKNRALPSLPKTGPVLGFRGGLFKQRDLSLYCSPFPGADHAVVVRSQRRLAQDKGIVPAQFGCYLTFESLGLVVLLSMVGVVFMILVKSRWGRSLLVNHPAMCTFGLVTAEGSTTEQLEQCSFSIRFMAHGYSADSARQGAPDMYLEAEMSGPDPGYISCSRFISQAAYVMLNKESLSGGVVTPAVALANSDYQQRLENRGITFNILNSGPDPPFSPLPTR